VNKRIACNSRTPQDLTKLLQMMSCLHAVVTTQRCLLQPVHAVLADRTATQYDRLLASPLHDVRLSVYNGVHCGSYRVSIQG